MKFSWMMAVALTLFGLVSVPAAHAQLSRGEGPVNVSADDLEVVDSKNLAIYKGHVDVTQDDARLQADRIEIQFAQRQNSNANRPGTGWGDIITITAKGNVFYSTPKQVVRGDQALYQVSSDTITMTGNVVLTQSANVIRAQTLVLNVDTGDASFKADGVGRRSKNRVRSVFFPSKEEK